MAIYKLPSPIPSLAVRIKYKVFYLPLRSLRVYLWQSAACAAILAFSCMEGRAFQGYNVIITTTPTVQAAFLTATTSQFQAIVMPNPLASNTYSINLTGINSNYVVPSTASCFSLDVDVDTTTLENDLAALVAAGPQIITDPYVYGFASGMAYAQHQDNILTEQFEVKCSTALSCQAVTSAIDQAIFQESLSTPTVIPMGF